MRNSAIKTALKYPCAYKISQILSVEGNSNMSVVIIAVLYGTIGVALANVPLVETPLGKVSGRYESSYEGRIYSAFYGVPYAKPPIGNLRFEKPQPVSTWDDVLDATYKEIRCAQVNHLVKPKGGIYQGQEDCLYLNIFTPRVIPYEGELLDVIVFIHGGAFTYGSNNKGSRFLMDRDIVFVSINYRLGTLGFLSTEDGVLPANLGLRDQTQALKWIQQNIESFGGNPNSITLTGLSAGGSSVHFHYFSPLSKGLFHRGISISGTALGPSKMQENPLEKTKKVAKSLGCSNETTTAMVDCMKTKSAQEVAKAIKVLRHWGFYPYSPVGVAVETYGDDKFLPDHPIQLISKNAFHDLPWINTFTSEEGLYPGLEFISDPKYLEEVDENWNELAPHIFDYKYTVSDDKMDRVSQDIKKEYLKQTKLCKETFLDFIGILSDRMFIICAEESSKLQANFSTSDIYNYYFTYPGDGLKSVAIDWIGEHKPYGVDHGDDMRFIISNKKNPFQELSESDEKMKNILLDMWSSFAKFNKPIIDDVEWTPVSKKLNGPLEHLHIRLPTDMQMEDAYIIDRHREFWKSLPIMENLKLYPNLLKITKTREEL